METIITSNIKTNELLPQDIQLDKIINSYLLPLFIGENSRGRSKEVRNATAFIFKPEDEVFLVTAAHVYDAAVNRTRGIDEVWVGVGQAGLCLSQRMIDYDHDLDIATFRISPDEAKKLEAEPVAIGRSGWPPPCPQIGDIAVIAGFPEEERILDDDGVIGLGGYMMFLRIEEVDSRNLRFHLDYNLQKDYLGTGLPPEGYNLSGLSGSPVILIEQGQICSWRLCGVTKVHGYSAKMVIATRTDLIDKRGRIRRGKDGTNNH